VKSGEFGAGSDRCSLRGLNLVLRLPRACALGWVISPPRGWCYVFGFGGDGAYRLVHSFHPTLEPDCQ